MRKIKITEEVYQLVKSLSGKIKTKEIAKIVNLSSGSVNRIANSENISDYRSKLNQTKAKYTAKTKKTHTPADFDPTNSIMVKLNALEYTLNDITRILKEMQSKKFRLF